MKDLTLVLLAAGLGSRYGGAKQLEGFGPSGETLMDYTVHDAAKAGFTRAVFVIRRDMEAVFRERIAPRYAGRIKVDSAFQELDDLPAGFRLPGARVKPWGTGHALLAARKAVQEPFCVCNADDFYGAEAAAAAARHLAAAPEGEGCVVTWRLGSALSEHGTVSRGVCEVENGWLKGITERRRLQAGMGGVLDLERPGCGDLLPLDSPVSMQYWAFQPSVFGRFWLVFERFCSGLKDPLKDEFFLPAAVDAGISEGWLKVRALPAGERWFGATHKEDAELVRSELRALVKAGVYPENLFA